jgi:hypothetical protein
MGFVNGTLTPPNAWGVTVGTDNGDRIAGTSVYGTGGNNVLFGTPGHNDSFVISLANLQSSSGLTNHINAADVIYDFSGAGGFVAGSPNDFLALTGFSAGSTLTFSHFGMVHGAVNDDYQFYTVHDEASNASYTIFINSPDGNKLVSGDYAFYA